MACNGVVFPGEIVQEDLSLQAGSAIYAIENVYVPGTLVVYVNGIYQGPSGKHVQEDSETFDTFVFLDSVPESGDEIFVEYTVGYVPL